MNDTLDQSGAGATVPEHPIVFYDGECGLCTGFVQWLLKRDRRRVLRMAPLQGSTAERTIGKPTGDVCEWTIFLLDADGCHERSEAALRILQHLGGMWSLLGVFRIVPRFVRDAVYRFIARHRLGWFGGATACRLPSDEERRQLLP
jgi:predicted DCC family thiol-disulfide oxidoreductase YuxK